VLIVGLWPHYDALGLLRPAQVEVSQAGGAA
jgi:hypothetical protein